MQKRFLRASVALATFATTTIMALAADITGVIRDKDGETLPQASVRLLTQKDSTFVAGTVTNNNGRFRLTGVKPGSYIVKVAYVGYGDNDHNLKVDNSNIRMEPIVMAEESKLLKEVNVVGVRTPIKVMEDTIEYNADTYKTQPNAVVEDLLKRLPGVEVDASSGKITANGKEVTKIPVSYTNLTMPTTSRV